MWQSIKSIFGFNNAATAANDPAALAEQIARNETALAEQAALQAREQTALRAQEQAAVQQPAANDEIYDLVGEANTVATAQLSRFPVKRLLRDKQTSAVNLPVQKVEIGGYTGSSPFRDNHVSVQLRVTLHDAVGNYEIDSLNNAVHGWLGSLPSLVGHVKFDVDLAQQQKSRKDVYQELQPLLVQSGKFSEQELGLIGQYFDRGQTRSADWNDRDHINIHHDAGKVQVQIRSEKVDGDEAVARSGEQRTKEYLEKHKGEILAYVKAEVGKLNVLKPEQITALDADFTIKDSASGIHNIDNGPRMEFGTRCADGKIEKSALAEIDTEKLDRIITNAILFSGKELPDIFGRIADGPTVKAVVEQRLGKSDALGAVFKHKMFDDESAWNREYEADQKANRVPISNAQEGPADTKNVLSFNFALPVGVTLQQLRTDLTTAQHQMKVTQDKAITELTPGLAA